MNNPKFIYLFVFLLHLLASTEMIAQCETDTIPPTCIAPPDRTMGCDSVEIVERLYFSNRSLWTQILGTAEATDNCSATIVELSPKRINQDISCTGSLRRRFIAVDEHGNQSIDTCEQIISPVLEKTLEHIIELPSLFDTFQTIITRNEFTPIVCTYKILAQGNFFFPPSPDTEELVSDYTFLDWCNPSISDYYYLPVFDIDGDGVKGDAYTLKLFRDSLYFQRPGLPDSVIADPQKSWRYTLNEPYEFFGQAFIDKNENCEADVNEIPLINQNITIKALPSGNIYQTQTDSLGNYRIINEIFFQDTLFEISLPTNLNLGRACGNVFFTSKPASSIGIRQDFAIQLVEDCPKMSVDIVTPRLRRCFNNNIYYIDYFNYSTDSIENVRVEVVLDPFLTFVESEYLAFSKGNNIYEFPIGTLPSGGSGHIRFKAEVSCEAELGQTHCVTANIFPAETCEMINIDWSGASIATEAICDGDSVRLRIKNIGTGEMIQENSFVVTEDVLMLRQGSFQLEANSLLEISYPANGATYRLEAEQARLHPGNNRPTAVIEGCGGINSPGLVNAFPHNEGNVFTSVDCQENIGSYDPNDKSATPTGWSAEHYLAKNTDIEYLIRFQNTGTDTAFKVVIRDTLSSFLQANTTLPGVSSHEYTFQQFYDSTLNQAILQFTFDNILLPDSTTNQEGSNGFVKFKIAQQNSLTDGTRIENKAAIFFDFNEPIITNTVFHTIGELSRRVSTNTIDVHASFREIRVYPNPFQNRTVFSVEGTPIQTGELLIFNAVGKMVYQKNFSGSSINLDATLLSKGIYFYKIRSVIGVIGSGKLVFL